MARFGRAEGRYLYWGEVDGQAIERAFIQFYRDAKCWDVVVNYFFALLFISCLIVGVLVNPFVLWYHSRQSTSFAKVLFLLISFIDQIKSLYFPLVFVPKLLSLQNDNDYYYDQDLSSTSWTSYSNSIVSILGSFEKDLLVVLCVSRHITLRNPLSSAQKRNAVFSAVLSLCFLYKTCLPILGYLHKPLGYMRLVDSVLSMNVAYIERYSIIKLNVQNALDCLLLLIAGLFNGLTIFHLKNSDAAASNSSTRNIRRGIIAILAMNVFNAFALLSNVTFSILIYFMNKADWHKFQYSTCSDAIQFTNAYGVVLIQSAYNSMSFLFICSSFRLSVRNLFRRFAGPSTDRCKAPQYLDKKDSMAQTAL